MNHEEIYQKLYILLSARKGGFIYDRQLGSDIFQVDVSQPECIPLIESKARNALSGFPEAEIVGVTAENTDICVSVQIDDEIYEIDI